MLDRVLAKHAQALAIVNLLLILRSSIHTRLSGRARIGERRVAMIPVGGKSVETAAQSFSRRIGELTDGLRKAVHVVGRNAKLRAACEVLVEELPSVFRDAHYAIESREAGKRDGLLSQPMKETFARNFNQVLKVGFGGLLELSPFPKGAVAIGGMLVEPVAGSAIGESKRFQNWDDRVVRQVRRLKGILAHIDREEVPSNLRGSIDDIEGWLGVLRASPHETEFLDRVGSAMRFVAAPVAAYDRAAELAGTSRTPTGSTLATS